MLKILVEDKMKRISFVALLLILSGVILAAGPRANATTLLADQPVFTTSSVPGNILFTPSVEFPTAISTAFPANALPYNPNNTFIGYFDPGKCYLYHPDTVNDPPVNGYFSPYSMAASHNCPEPNEDLPNAVPLWSGNWLNWASMQTIDEFRMALTGGYRSIDTPTQTILEKAWSSYQGSDGNNAPDKAMTNNVNNVAVYGATPFKWTSAYSRIWSLGNSLYVTGSSETTRTWGSHSVTCGTLSGSYKNPSTGAWSCLNYGGNFATYPTVTTSSSQWPASVIAYSNQWGAVPATNVYALQMRVEVCDPSVGLEGDCVQYADGYKPEGLIQKNAKKIRYGVMAYLNTDSRSVQGGVLRARMAYVGPTMPDASNPSLFVSNPTPEWDPTTGVDYQNPDLADAQASGVSNSGVINYLNKFGEASHVYRTYDVVGELFYAASRYYKDQGPVAAYYTNAKGAALDGFPAITDWSPAPIQYSCQKNFYVGIGDTNTWDDAVLPGSSLSDPNQSTIPPEISADSTENVTKATNYIGQMEGLGNLASVWKNSGMNSTYYMAGIAYDDHVRDMLPNEFLPPTGPKTVIQTASTYWLDVQEGQTYTKNNQYYLATKYGGFKVPSNYVPYQTPVASLPLSAWHTNTDSLGPNCANCNLRPDNYFSAAQADQMVSGLAGAFASIGSALSASSTAFSFTSPQFASATGNASYSSTYNPSNWTGDVFGNTVSFDSAGNPTLTQSWSAASQLNARDPSTRIIATCCTSSGSGLPFEWGSLTSTSLSSRTDYGTFSSVGGVSAASQSGSNYLAYLRGDRSQEETNGGPYRDRSSVLGDITDSKLNPVGPPDMQYANAYNPGYSAFKSAYADRPTVVYVGANDGMMHAFDGTVPGGGQELFAYVPSFVYGNDTTGPVSGLASLGNPNFVHHNLVDATPETFDVDFNNTDGQSHDSPDWHTILIGGLGKGGKGYYAIDVTDPASITSESVLASKVLWEFTDSDMGYSYGDPTVVKTKEYGWVVILTSGYDNSSGTGFIYIVNPKTGALIQKIAVGNGSDGLPSDGLTYGSAYVQSYADYTADSYYVGDLNGHLWRLDLTPASGAYAAPTQIADLTDSSGSPQPITTRPLIEVQPGTQKRYVMVGTGRLLDPSDIADAQQQSFYAFIDGTVSQFNTAATLPSGETFPLTRADLMNDTTTLTTGIGTTPSAPSGWYVDLNATGSGPAERVDINPTANYGIVAFAANTPLGDVCNPSGTNRIFGIDFGSGTSVLIDTSNVVVASSNALPGVATDISITNVAGTLHITAGSSTGDVANIPGNLSGAGVFKQLNWSEVQSAD